MRLPTALAATTLAVLVLTATALAGTVSRSGGTLTFAAAPGETNNVSARVLQEDGSIEISDSGAPLTFDPSCVGSASSVECPGSGVTLVNIGLGDGDDNYTGRFPTNVHVTGGDGNDTIQAAFSGDPNDTSPHGTLEGGPGNDKIESDGGPFTLIGGPGDDSIVANFGDKIDCSGAGNDQVARQLGAFDKTVNNALINCGSGPNMSLKLPRTSVRSMLKKKSYHFSTTCDRACAIYWSFEPLSPGICHSLSRCYGAGVPKSDPNNHLLWTLTPGRQNFTAKVTGKARRGTAHHRGPLKVRLTVEALDQFSAARIVTRTFKIKH